MRTYYKWTIEKGLAFNHQFRAADAETDYDWSNWTGWRVRLNLADRTGATIIALDSDGGTDGTFLFTSGCISAFMTTGQTAALEATTSSGRGPVKPQLTGTVYATDPMYPDDPYPLAYVKAVVKEF